MGLFNRHTEKYNPELTAQLREASPWDTEAIESLLAQGANPNAPKKGNKSAPLAAAATVGCIPTMDVLIRHGADPNLFSGIKFHETPLLAAIYEGHIRAVEYLLDHGAKIDGTFRTGPPLEGAIYTENLEMLEFLLKHGADPNKKIFWDVLACERS
jgi:ankyrin repeat protein